MSSDDLATLRAKLAAREDGCWARLEDAVSELVALHGAGADDVMARVRAAIDAERTRTPGSGTPAPV